MESDKLGLSPEQQNQIDEIFVDTTLTALASMTSGERAYLVSTGDLSTELEDIHDRIYAQAADLLLRNLEIPQPLTSLLGKIAFIDSLSLPSPEILKFRDKRDRAFRYTQNRRLFRK